MKITNINIYNLYSAILGIRNSYKNKEKSDSKIIHGLDWYSKEDNNHNNKLYTSYNHCIIGERDEKLIKKLLIRNDEYGEAERKFLRQIMVSMDIEASLKMWAQIDTYKIGTTRNSESTMHSINKMELTNRNFERPMNSEHLNFINEQISIYNEATDEQVKRMSFEVIDANLPAGYLLESHWTANYEVLRKIYNQRKNHKMYYWKEFCNYIKELPYFELLIKGEKK